MSKARTKDLPLSLSGVSRLSDLEKKVQRAISGTLALLPSAQRKTPRWDSNQVNKVAGKPILLLHWRIVL
jgi:hypothetical protein